MKRFFVVLIALLTMAAFVSVPDAAAKKTKVLKAKGIITEYVKAEKITIKPAKGEPMTFAVTADTKLNGEVTVDAKVAVTYTKAAGGTMTATAIQVAPAKKKK
jgi:hypothetical protein